MPHEEMATKLKAGGMANYGNGFGGWTWRYRELHICKGAK
jgi:hypothetical protein